VNPLSAIFGAGVRLRNALYDRGRLSVCRLARPVVSIGNISVGGTGKTPFVIALGELLRQRAITFDVLSRGYGRNSTEIAVVEPSGTAAQFGDEPLLIARTLQAPVIVGGDRYQAGLLAEKQFSSKLHLLDDGFQHRRLHRDFDLVLLPAEDLTGSLLPVGRLREPVTSLGRADAVVVFEQPAQSLKANRLWSAHRRVELSPIGGLPMAFCGIARPEQFFGSLKALGQEIVFPMTFPDHHRYSQLEIDDLLRLRDESRADGFITTEKDAVNLAEFARQLEPLRIARLRLELEAPEQAINEMLQAIEQRSGCRL